MRFEFRLMWIAALLLLVIVAVCPKQSIARAPEGIAQVEAL